MKKKKGASKQETQLYEVGDVVGGKVKGYPMWPGLIEKYDVQGTRRRYTVRFFGSNDSSPYLMELKFFKDFTEKEKACKRPGFAEALKICEKYYRNNCMEDHRKHPEQIKAKEVEVEKKEEEVVAEQKNEENHAKEIDPQPNGDDHVEQEELPETLPYEPTTTITPTSKSPIQDVPMDISLAEVNPESDIKVVVVDKIKRKIDEKIKQKEELKQEKKNQKLGAKVSQKFPIIENQLNMLYVVFDTYMKPNSLNQSGNLAKWNKTVQDYNKLLPKLEDYIKKYFKYNLISKEREECLRILSSLAGQLNMAKDNKSLPKEIRSDAKSMRKNMKEHRAIKDFMNGKKVFSDKNAMTERKENDAAELK